MPGGKEYGGSDNTEECYVVNESRFMVVPELASQVRYGVASLVYHHWMSCRHQSASGLLSGAG